MQIKGFGNRSEKCCAWNTCQLLAAGCQWPNVAQGREGRVQSSTFLSAVAQLLEEEFLTASQRLMSQTLLGNGASAQSLQLLPHHFSAQNNPSLKLCKLTEVMTLVMSTGLQGKVQHAFAK